MSRSFPPPHIGIGLYWYHHHPRILFQKFCGLSLYFSANYNLAFWFFSLMLKIVLHNVVDCLLYFCSWSLPQMVDGDIFTPAQFVCDFSATPSPCFCQHLLLSLADPFCMLLSVLNLFQDIASCLHWLCPVYMQCLWLFFIHFLRFTIAYFFL